MKKIRITLLISVVGTMLLATACGGTQTSDKTAKPKATKAKNDIVEASGVVKASNIENIVIDFPATAMAKVTKIDIKEGQKVKKGDKLVELDLSDYNVLVTGKSKTIDADEDLKKDMQTDNQKSAQDLKIAAEQSELDAIKAKTSKSYISGSNVISDMDNAVVTDVGYKVGDAVSAEKAVITLEDLGSLLIQANVDEEFIKDVQEGKIVSIIPKSDPSSKLTGKVSRIESQAITQNGETYVPVEISIDNNNGKLLPNFNVDVEISKK
ncbi:MAG: efflux RND transporter periplasmic adaptor subunit [Bacillota bacterium]|nr:efflux RND transporter periplasmic adaptor subunit [Bacillota bacterium]